jgi:hypothetical protein
MVSGFSSLVIPGSREGARPAMTAQGKKRAAVSGGF